MRASTLESVEYLLWNTCGERIHRSLDEGPTKSEIVSLIGKIGKRNGVLEVGDKHSEVFSKVDRDICARRPYRQLLRGFPSA